MTHKRNVFFFSIFSIWCLSENFSWWSLENPQFNFKYSILWLKWLEVNAVVALSGSALHGVSTFQPECPKWKLAHSIECYFKRYRLIIWIENTKGKYKPCGPHYLYQWTVPKFVSHGFCTVLKRVCLQQYNPCKIQFSHIELSDGACLQETKRIIKPHSESLM